MLAEEELLNESQSLNKKKEYIKVIELLAKDIIASYQSADLYAEKALAYWRLDKYDLLSECVDQSLAKNQFQSKALFLKGFLFWKSKDNDKAIEFYNQAIDSNPQFALPFQGLGIIFMNQNQFKKAIDYFNKSIEIDNEYVQSYNLLGTAYRKLKQYDKALETYQKSLKIDPDVPYVQNNIGNTYFELKKYDEAIGYYRKSIMLNPKEVIFHYNMALVYDRLDNYKKAIEHCRKAIRLNPLYERIYYLRAYIYQKNGKSKLAISDYQQYIKLNKDQNDFFVSSAKAKIIELTELLKNPEFAFISELVKKIKSLLLFKESCITHYTGFTATEALILRDSLFRLSEGTYLNDTSEGRELFNFLPSLPASSSLRVNDTVAKQFIIKPFIGSFVAETKHDDLTLWRMYGKEKKEEARGCALTLERESFLESLKTLIIPGDEVTNKMDEEFNFYRVAYRKQESSKEHFIIPGATHDEKILNELMFDLKEKLNKVLEDKENIISIRNWSELNQIAYLFKSAEYQYEHELRLIVKGTGIEKTIDDSVSPPRVYINLVRINPLIKKITFGPKVEKADEWASAFYYTLDNQGFYPDIFISHLPFK